MSGVAFILTKARLGEEGYRKAWRGLSKVEVEAEVECCRALCIWRGTDGIKRRHRSIPAYVLAARRRVVGMQCVRVGPVPFSSYDSRR